MWETESKRSKKTRGRVAATRWGSTARQVQARERRLLVTLIVGCCAVVSVFVAVDFWANAGVIHRGVSVGA